MHIVVLSAVFGLPTPPPVLQKTVFCEIERKIKDGLDAVAEQRYLLCRLAFMDEATGFNFYQVRCTFGGDWGFPSLRSGGLSLTGMLFPFQDNPGMLKLYQQVYIEYNHAMVRQMPLHEAHMRTN